MIKCSLFFTVFCVGGAILHDPSLRVRPHLPLQGQGHRRLHQGTKGKGRRGLLHRHLLGRRQKRLLRDGGTQERRSGDAFF